MKFTDIAGQTRIKNYLLQTVRNNRVSHAQLFHGPGGSGKLAIAIAYAQYINCENKQVLTEGELRGDSCGICPSCVKYNKLAHPDLHFFFPIAATKDVKKPISVEFLNKWRNFLISRNYIVTLNDWYEEIGMENKQGIINAEDCNEITRLLSYKAYESEYKIVIIWFVEKLFHSAAPKILKILEEPPEKTLFILICENTDQILNTIFSRTQLVKIPKLTDRDIINVLSRDHQCSEIDARKIAALCDGNMELACRLVNENEEEDFNFINLRKWLRMCYKSDIPELAKFTEEIAKISRERQKSFLSYALRVTRHCILLNFRLDPLVRLEGEENTFVHQLSPFFNPSNGPLITEEINKAIFHIERNANAKILFMDLSLILARLLKITHESDKSL
jgi:DNA polymerase III subunit delta'